MKRISFERFSRKYWGNYNLSKESEYYYQSKYLVYVHGMSSYAYEVVFYELSVIGGRCNGKMLDLSGLKKSLKSYYFVRVNFSYNGCDFAKTKDFSNYNEFLQFIKLLNNTYKKED